MSHDRSLVTPQYTIQSLVPGQEVHCFVTANVIAVVFEPLGARRKGAVLAKTEHCQW